MKKVVILKNNLLPISETFIKEQVLSFSGWKATLVGDGLVAGGLSLNGLNFDLYSSSKQSWVDRQLSRARKVFNLANPLLVTMLKRHSPDLIHIHFATEAVTLWPSVRIFNKPVVVTLHGYDITTYKEYWYKQHNPISKLYPRRLLKIASYSNVYFVAVSEAIKQRAIEYGIPESKVFVHYIGINLDKFQVSPVPLLERHKRILFVGRLTEKKGVMYLLESFREISKAHPDVELVIAGTGEQLEQAQAFAAKHQVRVKFLGAVSHEQVKEEMQKARILCLPSVTAQNGDREGLPTVIMEAQAVGVPVVTSAHGGAAEGVLDGETGFAFAEKDIRSLTRHLSNLLENDNLAQCMAARSPAFAKERFDIKKCTSKLEGFYDSLLSSEKI